MSRGETVTLPIDHAISLAVREGHGVDHQQHLPDIEELTDAFVGMVGVSTTANTYTLQPALRAAIELGYYRREVGIESDPQDDVAVGQSIMGETAFPTSAIGASLMAEALQFGADLHELEQLTTEGEA